MTDGILRHSVGGFGLVLLFEMRLVLCMTNNY